MNPDDLQQRLQRLPLRSVPGEWRSEILNAARRARCPQPAGPNAQPSAWWRELLWPCPQAWACLAALWVVLLLLNLAARDPVRLAKASKSTPEPEFILALREHRRQLAELIGTLALIEPEKPFEPRPRSALSRPTRTVEIA